MTLADQLAAQVAARCPSLSLADQLGLAATSANYDALIAAGLALVIQGENPSPVLGPADTVATMLALQPVWSCYVSAAGAINAAAAIEDNDLDPAGINVLDQRRLLAAVASLTTRAAELHAAQAELLARRDQVETN